MAEIYATGPTVWAALPYTVQYGCRRLPHLRAFPSFGAAVAWCVDNGIPFCFRALPIPVGAV